ncbi:VCBS repeat-containing protein [Sulfidibacter corallicola]|uniref:VCBS repeat-containing protein n=1 Tax=Sulfidibacter corallicola TaxID=2818388 RepID=A0A8A4TCE1_SULCO|nr:VCBS repeat-containing protein [Sulfidibacter corallicola]QTD47769.1 VCBS repeat-containing protein [Sulfidibacter corallicola]
MSFEQPHGEMSYEVHVMKKWAARFRQRRDSRWAPILLLIAFCELTPAAAIDAVTANSLGQSTRLWMNQAQNQYEEVELDLLMDSGAETRSLALGDLDGDGDLDLFLGNDGANEVWLNDGFGNFTNTEQQLGTPVVDSDEDGDDEDTEEDTETTVTNSVNVVLGDINGDGDLDAVVANWNGAPTIWTNIGGAFFVASDFQFPSDMEDVRALALGDMDRDGDLDLVLGKTNAYEIQVWRNNGAGIFDLLVVNQDEVDAAEEDDDEDTVVEPRGYRFNSFSPFFLSLGDLDGDDDLDVFVANINDAPNSVLFNNGDGELSDSLQLLGFQRSTCVKLGDLDADGDLDAFVTNSDQDCDGANHIWLNDGSGAFEDGAYFGNSPSMWVDLADLDEDGDLDAFVANRGDSGSPNRVWLNDGSAQFSDSGQRLGSNRTAAVALGNIRNLETSDKATLIALPPDSLSYQNATLTLINGTSVQQSYALEAFDQDGNSIATLQGVLPAKSNRELAIADIAPSKATAAPAYFKQGDEVVVQTFLTIAGQEGPKYHALALPQVGRTWSFATGDAGNDHHFRVINPQPRETSVSISLVDETGTAAETRNLTIPANGSASVAWQTPQNADENWRYQVEAQVPVGAWTLRQFPEKPGHVYTIQPLPNR